MKKNLVILLALISIFLISLFFIQQVRHHTNQNFLIFTYHDIRPQNTIPNDGRTVTSSETFEQEILYLLDHRYVIQTLEEVMGRCRENGTLEQPTAVLTFDDSFDGQYRYAYPILKKYRLSGTFFIWSNVIDERGRLSWNNINEMRRGGMEMGGHTLSHPDLTTLQDTTLLKKEIHDNKLLIEEKITTKLTSFAYPFNSFSLQTEEEIKMAGYQHARTSTPGVNTCKDNPYTLKSFILNNSFDNFTRIFQ